MFVETGLWLRAQYFPQSGDPIGSSYGPRGRDHPRHGRCLRRFNARQGRYSGRDAAEFLECVYINGWKTLPVGKARYGLMLREDGFVMDDGTTSRLAEHHFLMTTTTANAVRVMQHLEFCHQALWPNLDVRMVSVTEQWAQFSIAGPRSREVLRQVVDAEHDLSQRGFPLSRRTRRYVSAAALRRACFGFHSRASLPMSSPFRRPLATR